MSEQRDAEKLLEAVFAAEQLVQQAHAHLRVACGDSAFLSLEAERLQLMLHKEATRARQRLEKATAAVAR